MRTTTDPEYDQALAAKRVRFVRELKQALYRARSTAGQVTAVYSTLIDEVILDTVLEVHRAAKTGKAVKVTAAVPGAHTPNTLYQGRGEKGVVDAFGQSSIQIQNDEVCCSNCSRRLAASRFAPHLEKCLGRGRTTSRAPSRRYL